MRQMEYQRIRMVWYVRMITSEGHLNSQFEWNNNTTSSEQTIITTASEEEFKNTK